MPGIVGIIRKTPSAETGRDLRLMTESMRHESYYLDGQYVNPRLGLHAAWLAHPDSLGASMPLVSEDRQVVLIILGEHFSHSHPAGSENGNGAFRRPGQELLRLYEESEKEFLTSLNGWFCGLAIDLRRARVTLFNDRYGMGRVYFHESSDEFIFASEAKALLRVRPALRAIEPAAMAQYLRFNCVMGNRTLFKDVSLLPGASSRVFDGGAAPQKRSYFDFADWEQQPVLPDGEFHRRFEDTVSRVFPAYMNGGQTVGLSLTAGLDTRVILAAAKQQDDSFPCYTFGGLWGETFDIRTARKLAALCHQPHEVIRIDEPFLRDFPNYARKSVYISDGTHDILGAHDVYFNQVARTIAPIRLTGKFGSEVVRTRRLIPSGDFPRHLVQPGLVPFLEAAPALRENNRKVHPLSRTLAEEIAWYELGRVSVEQAEVTLRTPYMDNELVRLMYRASPGLRDSRDLQARYVRHIDPKLGDVPTNMGRVRENGGSVGRIAYGLFWALFKVEFIYLYATPHWLTRIDRKLERLRLERIIAGRQKFEGYRIWMKTHLADFLRETLLSSRARCTEFFDKTGIEKAVTGHTAGTHNYLNEINKMLTVELIYSSLLADSPGQTFVDESVSNRLEVCRR